MSETAVNGPDPMIGRVLHDRYRLLSMLGEGGMGVVYAAEHIHIKKKFAVKLLRKEIVGNDEAVARFKQEAYSASSINHKNIVEISDFGELEDGRIYLCMEYLNGVALNDLIHSERLTLARQLNILIQTAHGLAAAHKQGIVHRDMKPENVFITDVGATDTPKLLDFGIAKVSGQDGQNNLTRTGTIFGTPYYMAPEQALGQGVDQRVDIYAMGVIMYEMFSGSVPFEGESFMGILTQHITTPAEAVEVRAQRDQRDVPEEVRSIINTCMQKPPENRFQTMDELLTALVTTHSVLCGPGMSGYLAQPTPRWDTHSTNNGPSPFAGRPGYQTGHAPIATEAAPAVSVAIGDETSQRAVSAADEMSMPAKANDTGLWAEQPKKRSKLLVPLLLLLALGGGVAVLFATGTFATGTKDKNSSSSSLSTATVDSSSSRVSSLAMSSSSSSALSSIGSSSGAVVAFESVLVESKPRYAEVWIGGTMMGVTPLRVRVPKGEHVAAELRKDGYDDVEKKISADSKKVKYKLKRRRGKKSSSRSSKKSSSRSSKKSSSRSSKKSSSRSSKKSSSRSSAKKKCKGEIIGGECIEFE